MRYSFPYLLIMAGVLLLFSCKKPTLNQTDIIAQENVGLEFTDTLTIVANTVKEDSIFAENLSISPIGAMDDPTFGKTYAGVYTRVLLASNNIDLGDSLVFDSLVLTLDYSGSYGDLSMLQSLVVYEMGEQLSTDETYYSNKEFTLDGEIGRKDNFIHNLDDDVVVLGDTLSPHLRIRLDSTFGENLMNQSGQSTLQDNASFFDYLNGIYITADTNVLGEGMPYFDLISLSLTRLRLYYSNSENDSLELQFFLSGGNDGIRVNHYSHDYSGSVAEPYLTSSNASGDSILFVQSMSGIVGRYEVPYLKNLGNILINKAELVITQVEDPSTGEDSTFTSPGTMTLVPEDGDFVGPVILDQFIPNFFGGDKECEVDTTSTEYCRYKFNLARQMQAILDNDTGANTAIWIKTFPSSRIADRVVIGGTDHSNGDIKLNLTYTKID